ncbi:MAG: tryptophan synthase subunit alpha [Chloroflexi bacterium]|nr:tryptophan synthase subunit alpha [Chloroflexota bacterium]
MTLTTITGSERISRAFGRARAEGRMAIAIYLTVGFPDRATTPALLRAALDGGADLIELGVPFSDPMADGTTIQRAGEAALRGGVRLEDCVADGASLVSERDATVLLMGYLNPFLRFGPERLAAECVRSGIAGVIVPDLPAEESGELDTVLVPADVARIDLYAPTTPDERLARLLPAARGFVYCVSLTGVTGARAGLSDDVRPFVQRVRGHTTLPVAVGFGIGRPEHVRALRGIADGVIVGSAAIDAVAQGGERALRDLVRSLREAGAA